MIEKVLFGPIELLPAARVDRAVLELEGVTAADYPHTTYVFLDEIHSEKVEELTRTKCYAGSFSIIKGSSESLRMDITDALNTTLEIRPNFHLSFLTPSEVEHDPPVFGFRQLHIHRTPAMDPHPLTHTITSESFFKEGPFPITTQVLFSLIKSNSTKGTILANLAAANLHLSNLKLE